VGIGIEALFGGQGEGALCAGEEAGHLFLALGGQDAAGGVDQTAARLDHAAVVAEDLLLFGLQVRQLLRLQVPFGVRIAPPDPGAGAGNIEKEAVGRAGEPFDDLGRGDRSGLDDLRAGAAGAMLQYGQFFSIAVEGNNPAPVFHQGGEMEGFTAVARAAVHHPHAGPNPHKSRHRLGGGILQLKPSLSETIPLKNRSVPFEHDGRRGPFHQAAGVSHAGGLGEQCGGCRLQGIGAQNLLRRAVQRGQEFFPTVAAAGHASLIEPVGQGFAQGADGGECSRPLKHLEVGGAQWRAHAAPEPPGVKGGRRDKGNRGRVAAGQGAEKTGIADDIEDGRGHPAFIFCGEAGICPQGVLQHGVGMAALSDDPGAGGEDDGVDVHSRTGAGMLGGGGSARLHALNRREPKRQGRWKLGRRTGLQA